jgi:hypothetical protein
MYYFLPPSYVHPSSPHDVYLYLDLCFRSPDFIDSKTCHTFRSTDFTVTPAGGKRVVGHAVPRGTGPTLFVVPATMTHGTIRVSGSEQEAGGGFQMTITIPLDISFRLHPIRN